MDRYKLLISGFIRKSIDDNKSLFWIDLLKAVSNMHSNEFIALINAFKEGWVLKKSKHLKVWRKRWVKLSMGRMETYKTKKCECKPTQVIDLKILSSVKTTEDGTLNGFNVYNEEMRYEFIAKDEGEKWDWMRRIAKSIILIHFQHQQQILNAFHHFNQMYKSECLCE